MTASNSDSRTCSGTSTALQPRCCNSQVIISGERTCSIGSPTMPYSRVRPLRKLTWSECGVDMLPIVRGFERAWRGAIPRTSTVAAKLRVLQAVQ
jgi:hypothetical protein